MSNLEIEVRRLEQADAPQSYCCMTEVPTPWVDALCQCRDWVAQNLHQHVEGYHARVDGNTIGHLYYAPSERALFPYQVEPGATVIYCEWVQRKYQGQGVAHRLFGTFATDQKNQGCKGILIECTEQEGMTACRHYLPRGFKPLQESSHKKLLYLALSQPSIQFQPLTSTIVPHRRIPVEILVLSGYLCPVDVSTQVQLLEIVREFGNQVVLRQERLTPATLKQFGAASGIFINGRQKLIGAHTEQAIRQAIVEEMQ